METCEAHGPVFDISTPGMETTASLTVAGAKRTSFERSMRTVVPDVRPVTALRSPWTVTGLSTVTVSCMRSGCWGCAG